MKCKISWQNYIASILNKSHEIYDNLSFEKEEKLPSIIKASAYIQSKLKEHNKNAIFVVPECELSSCLFSVVNAISYILSGKNKGDITTIDDFEPNTKVRALGCTILFKGVEERDGIKRVRFAFKDEGSGFLALPDALPVFQKSEGKLSSFNNWEKHYAKWKASSNESIEPSLLVRIKDKKSFLEGSVVYVGNLQNSRNILSNAYIKGQDLRDILVIKYLMKDGGAKALKGVVSGIPPLLLVSNTNQVADLIQSGANILGVIIDYSQKSDSFIERLKTILRNDIPISIISKKKCIIDAKYYDFSIGIDGGEMIGPCEFIHNVFYCPNCSEFIEFITQLNFEDIDNWIKKLNNKLFKKGHSIEIKKTYETKENKYIDEIDSLDNIKNLCLRVHKNDKTIIITKFPLIRKKNWERPYYFKINKKEFMKSIRKHFVKV